jgi:hypothetical protein
MEPQGNCSLVPGFFDYGCGWNESICVPRYDVNVDEFACHCDAGWGGPLCNDTTTSYYDHMEFYEDHQDCDLLSPSGSFEQCRRSCVPRGTCPPMGCEFLGLLDKWQLCNGRCVPIGECLETACQRLTVALNRSFGACNGSCVPETCDPVFVNTTGADWIRIEVSASIQLTASKVIDEEALTRVIADSVGESLGVRSEAIAVVFTSIVTEIRSRMVVLVDGELEPALFQQGLATAFGLPTQDVSLLDARRSLQSTRNIVPFLLRIVGTDSDALSQSSNTLRVIESTAMQTLVASALSDLGHPALQSLTVTTVPEITTSVEYTVVADGIPNAPGAEDAVSAALGLGPTDEGSNATGLAGMILASEALPDVAVLSAGVRSVSSGIASDANAELTAPPPPPVVDNSSAVENTTVDTAGWELVEEDDEEEERIDYSSPLMLLYIVGGTLAIALLWVKVCSKLLSKLVSKVKKNTSKVSPYDAGTDSDEEKAKSQQSRKGQRRGALVSYDEDEDSDGNDRPATSSTTVAKRSEFGREAAALRNKAKFGETGSTIGGDDDTYSYYSEEDRPLSAGALAELEWLQAKAAAAARKKLRTPVTPPVPRIEKASDVRGKLKERREKKEARLKAIAEIDEKLRQAADERGTKANRKMQSELLKQKAELAQAAAAHNQDFDGLDGKRVKKVKSRKAQSVWSDDRKKLQADLKGRRPKSRLNELKDRAIRLKMKEALAAQEVVGSGVDGETSSPPPPVPPIKSWPTVLVRQYLTSDQLQAEEQELGSPLSQSPVGVGWRAANFFAAGEDIPEGSTEAKRGAWDA